MAQHHHQSLTLDLWARTSWIYLWIRLWPEGKLTWNTIPKTKKLLVLCKNFTTTLGQWSHLLTEPAQNVAAHSQSTTHCKRMFGRCSVVTFNLPRMPGQMTWFAPVHGKSVPAKLQFDLHQLHPLDGRGSVAPQKLHVVYLHLPCTPPLAASEAWACGMEYLIKITLTDLYIPLYCHNSSIFSFVSSVKIRIIIFSLAWGMHIGDLCME